MGVREELSDGPDITGDNWLGCHCWKLLK